jgi:hypothetical protein
VVCQIPQTRRAKGMCSTVAYLLMQLPSDTRRMFGRTAPALP